MVSKAYNLDWKALVEEQQTSGLNMKAFCRERELPYQAFKNHKYTLQETNSASFLPVKQAKTDMLRVTINGNVICFEPDTKNSDISRILKAIAV